MRILAILVLIGIIYALPLSQVAVAGANKTLDQNSQQKSKKENSEEIQNNNSIKSSGENFITSVYIAEINLQKIAKFERNRLTNYASHPKGGFVINASAYTAAADECGKSNGVTASGKKVTEGRTLACPKGFAFGTKIQIDGMGMYVCEDRGGAINGNHFDVYMQTKKQAFAFGRKNLIARVMR